jgi:hypothetical protein
VAGTTRTEAVSRRQGRNLSCRSILGKTRSRVWDFFSNFVDFLHFFP